MPGGGKAPRRVAGARLALIVDDDVVCRLFCRQTLEAAGYKVLECSNAADALAESVRAHPAVILLDLRLHGANGCHIAADILRAWPAARTQCCIIGMTADRADQARTGLLQAGCSAVLFKPFSGGELHTLIDRSPAVTDAHRWPCNREDPLRNGPLAVRLHWPPAPGLQSAFLGELKRQLPVLDGAVTSLNWHEAEHVLHRITGAAALAGFNRLSLEARAMLRQVRQQDDTVCLAEHYLELLSQSAMLLRSPPGDGEVALRQF